MKCQACGYENIYGSTVCKQCGTSLTAKQPEPESNPVVVPHTQVTSTAPAPQASSPRAEDQNQATYPNELTFIPYIGNEQFNYFIRVLRRAFDFSGRSTRSEFWWFSLFQILSVIAVSIVLPFLSMLYTLILFIPAISVSIRRLHDIGKSGWWLLALVIPLIGAIILLVFWIKASEQSSNKWGSVQLV